MGLKRSGENTTLPIYVGIVVVLSVVIVLLLVLGEAGLGVMSVPSQVPPNRGGGGSVSPSNSTYEPLLTASEAVGTVEAAYQSVANSTIQPSSFPSPSLVGARIYSAFENVSVTPAFAALNDDYGADGFTFQVGGDASAGVTRAYFGFSYVSNNKSWTEYWVEDVSSARLYGPELTSMMAVSGTYDSTNWAGQIKQLSGGRSLVSVYTDGLYPTFSKASAIPTHVPSNVTISQLGSYWIGATEETNGNDGLLQTGILSDVSNGSAYGVPWYEFWCEDGCQPVARQALGFWNDTGQLSEVAYGDIVSGLVKWSGSPDHWILQDEDHYTDTYDVENLSVLPWLPSGFHPIYSDTIVEAMEYGTTIQQIPSFTDAYFWDLTVCPTRSLGSCSYDYNLSTPSTYGTWQLTQAPSNDNTVQGNSPLCGGIYDECGYPYIGWYNSNYNYTYVNG